MQINPIPIDNQFGLSQLSNPLNININPTINNKQPI